MMMVVSDVDKVLKMIFSQRGKLVWMGWRTSSMDGGWTSGAS
jgi:hypothetical protein